MYLYLTARSEAERQLIEAECIAITGVSPDENGIALAETEADVSRAAYIKTCMKVIVSASDLSELYEQLERANVFSEQFRVSVAKIPKRLPLDSRQIMHQVGARIEGNPDLSNPRTIFLVVANQERIWLGEVLSESSGAWNEHSQKFHLYSSALPTRLARAMVNLVAAPGDRIIDPCCGSGTILIEAVSIGIKAVGCDINPKLVYVSIENLRYFSLSSLVLMADARNIKGSFDAVVTDLPYGRNCPSDGELNREILQNLKELAPKAAVVTGEDMSDLLLRMGYDVKRVIAVPKASLTRYIHVVHHPS
jgi:putative methyltransferase (TIGR01177 family)